ncbi:MAG: DEAD/DEAH box helicase [Verrucomicrobia bacterium]|nr:DEAD/DEAH box helicase [Verrucomicrobiota bacterium]MBS0645765.1 DEAD/DEAH box helicase [Verrucomicrobiota bacterium]
MTNFSSYPLDPLVLSSLNDMGFTAPTPIQEETIPLILEGSDCVALAETGSGKTAACAIPICSKVDVSSTHIQALVMVPTRELALQYATETQKIGRLKGVKAFALFGGEDTSLQRAKLKSGVHILIATPGRLIDFIYQQAIDLSHLTTLILDEADQMLSLGFYDDLDFIMNCLVQKHQTLLFSATMPDRILKLSKSHMQQPKEIRLNYKKPTPANLSFEFLFSAIPHHKIENLIELLGSLQVQQCIIFGNARQEVEKLYYLLKPKFHPIEYLHGGLDQNLRTSIIQRFAKGKVRYLVASDVASRGLDFSQVTHVINLHLPPDQDTYLHRAGRTGRSGESGVCITLVTRRDLAAVKKLLQHLKREPRWIGPPPKNFTL